VEFATPKRWNRDRL